MRNIIAIAPPTGKKELKNSSDWDFNTVMVIDDKNKLYTLKGACFQSLKIGDTIQ